MTATRTPNEQIVIDFFATLSSGDLARLAEMIDPDTTWTPMVRDVPGAGTHTGRQITEEFLAPVRGLFVDGDPKVHVDNMVSSADRVMCETHATGTLRDGRAYLNRYAWGFDLQGGRIKAIREYMDSHYVMTHVVGL